MTEENTAKQLFYICNRCRKKIEDSALIYIQPAILLQKMVTQTPYLFSCPEHAENYLQTMVFHDTCWMEELKDHGVKINDLKEVKKQYAKKKLEELLQESHTDDSAITESLITEGV